MLLQVKPLSIAQRAWVSSLAIHAALYRDDDADLSATPDHLLRSTPFQHLVKVPRLFVWTPETISRQRLVSYTRIVICCFTA